MITTAMLPLVTQAHKSTIIYIEEVHDVSYPNDGIESSSAERNLSPGCSCSRHQKNPLFGSGVGGVTMIVNGSRVEGGSSNRTTNFFGGRTEPESTRRGRNFFFFFVTTSSPSSVPSSSQQLVSSTVGSGVPRSLGVNRPRRFEFKSLRLAVAE